MIKTFLEQLKPFGSKVVISPLSEQEVRQIEKQLNRALPGYYREFLLNIGLRQDAVWGLNESLRDFGPLTGFLPEGPSERFFGFGNNGGEDYWLLNSAGPDDITIYEYGSYCNYEIKSLGKTFEGLLNEAIGQLRENAADLIDNTKKTWAVQIKWAQVPWHQAEKSPSSPGPFFSLSMISSYSALTMASWSN